MKNEKCAKEEPHSEFTKEEQQEFLNLLGRISLLTFTANPCNSHCQ